MPKEKKKNVDIDGLSSLMQKVFIAIGLVLIIGYYLFSWLEFKMIADSMILIAPLVGITFLGIKAPKYDHNKQKKTKLPYIILGIIILFISVLIYYGIIPIRQ